MSFLCTKLICNNVCYCTQSTESVKEKGKNLFCYWVFSIHLCFCPSPFGLIPLMKAFIKKTMHF